MTPEQERKIDKRISDLTEIRKRQIGSPEAWAAAQTWARIDELKKMKEMLKKKVGEPIV